MDRTAWHTAWGDGALAHRSARKLACSTHMRVRPGLERFNALRCNDLRLLLWAGNNVVAVPSYLHGVLHNRWLDLFLIFDEGEAGAFPAAFSFSRPATAKSDALIGVLAAFSSRTLLLPAPSENQTPPGKRQHGCGMAAFDDE